MAPAMSKPWVRRKVTSTSNAIRPEFVRDFIITVSCVRRPSIDPSTSGLWRLHELVTLVADTFPWTLQSVHGYPERTSDRKHLGPRPTGYGEAIRTARRRRHREAQALAHRGPDGCSRRVR
jgi:hypothetical protein